MKQGKKPLIYFTFMALATAYIIFSGPIFMGNLPFLLVQFFSILLIIWAILAKKLQKSVHKNLPRGFFLVTSGPYEIIRHPIYAALLLIMSAFVQGYPSITRFFFFLILLLVVLLKITYDERSLEEQIKGYQDYRKKTHKLIPYLY